MLWNSFKPRMTDSRGRGTRRWNRGEAFAVSVPGKTTNTSPMGKWMTGAELAEITQNATGNGAGQRRNEHGTVDL